MRKISSEKAAILITSLWVLVILSVLATGLAHQLILELRLMRAHSDSIKAFYAACAGVERAIAQRRRFMLPVNKVTMDTYGHSWLNDEQLFKAAEFEEAVFTIENQDVPGLYGMSDEQARIDINNATFLVLKALFKQKVENGETAAAMAAAVIDWRDSDNDIFKDPASGQLIGAEDEYYKAQNPPYTCKNGFFDLTEELSYVRDINYEDIKDCVTVYAGGSNRAVNINTAQKAVLEAVLGEPLADYIINRRQLELDNKPVKWFSVSWAEPGEESSRIINIRSDDPDPALPGLDGAEKSVPWRKLRDMETAGAITVSSSVFRIKCTADVKGIKKTVEAVVEFSPDSSYIFRYWRQY